MVIFRTCCWLLLGLVLAVPAGAQSTSAAGAGQASDRPTAPGRVRVYLDCTSGGLTGDQCFSTYLRDQITFVDFVRDPDDADVHVLARGQGTGGGGREVVLRLVGRGRFAGHDHDLKVLTLAGDTENTRRELLYRTAMVGLLDYVAHDGIPPGIDLSVRTEPRQPQDARPDDPWNLWVFSARASASFEADERSRERSDNLSFTADRVTDAWKIGLGAEFFDSLETFELDEEATDEPFSVTREVRTLDAFVAKSLGDRWSAGVRGRAGSSTFNNNRRTFGLAPAIEFNAFPYRDYASRQLRIEYNAGIDDIRYHELTIFQKLEETLWRHQVEVTLDQREPWGSVRAGLDWLQYLHDPSKFRLEGEGSVNLRLTRGLSLSLRGSASRIRNQLSLPLRDATNEEVLLRIRQIQSGFQTEFDVGVTYTFGSLFNNVVNPRFGL